MPKDSPQSPFAKLAGLRDALPAGVAPSAPAGGRSPGTIGAILERRERARTGASASHATDKGARTAPARDDADEAAVFLSEMAGVAPLGAPARGRVTRAQAPPRPRVATDDAEVLAALADLCDPDEHFAFDWADTDEHLEGIAHGVDRRLLKRLRAGEFALQAHVDLHGLTRAEAKEQVVAFVATSRRAGLRAVLVVHGRGLHSKDHVPVLKLALQQWLERGPLARAVLAFATARPADGGAGAVMLLLRRGDGRE